MERTESMNNAMQFMTPNEVSMIRIALELYAKNSRESAIKYAAKDFADFAAESINNAIRCENVLRSMGFPIPLY